MQVEQLLRSVKPGGGTSSSPVRTSSSPARPTPARGGPNTGQTGGQAGGQTGRAGPAGAGAGEAATAYRALGKGQQARRSATDFYAWLKPQAKLVSTVRLAQAAGQAGQHGQRPRVPYSPLYVAETMGGTFTFACSTGTAPSTGKGTCGHNYNRTERGATGVNARAAGGAVRGLTLYYTVLPCRWGGARTLSSCGPRT